MKASNSINYFKIFYCKNQYMFKSKITWDLLKENN